MACPRPEFIAPNPWGKVGHGGVSAIPELGKQKKEDPWGSLAKPPSLLSEPKVPVIDSASNTKE